MKAGDKMMWHYPHETAFPVPVELVREEKPGWVVRRDWGSSTTDFWACDIELKAVTPESEDV